MQRDHVSVRRADYHRVCVVLDGRKLHLGCFLDWAYAPRDCVDDLLESPVESWRNREVELNMSQTELGDVRRLRPVACTVQRARDRKQRYFGEGGRWVRSRPRSRALLRDILRVAFGPHVDLSSFACCWGPGPPSVLPLHTLAPATHF